jgi:hypothetical protein
VDPDAGKITIQALADRYMSTVDHQASETVEKKRAIGKRIKARDRGRQSRSRKVRSSPGWLHSISAPLAKTST